MDRLARALTSVNVWTTDGTIFDDEARYAAAIAKAYREDAGS